MITSAELQATHRARRIRLQKSTIIAVCLRVTDTHYKHIVFYPPAEEQTGGRNSSIFVFS